MPKRRRKTKKINFQVKRVKSDYIDKLNQKIIKTKEKNNELYTLIEDKIPFFQKILFLSDKNVLRKKISNDIFLNNLLIREYTGLIEKLENVNDKEIYINDIDLI